MPAPPLVITGRVWHPCCPQAGLSLGPRLTGRPTQPTAHVNGCSTCATASGVRHRTFARWLSARYYQLRLSPDFPFVLVRSRPSSRVCTTCPSCARLPMLEIAVRGACLSTTKSHLADYISLWRVETPGDRGGALPAAQTFTPKARVWLRTSQVKTSGGSLGILGLVGEAWAIQTSRKPALFGGEWLSSIRNEPNVPFGVRLGVRGTGSAEIRPPSWQAVEWRGEMPSRMETSQPSVSFGIKNPSTLRGQGTHLPRATQTLDIWQPNGWSCPPTFPRKEKRVNPPVRTWIGGLRQGAARPALAQKVAAAPTFRAFNSYSRRYPPTPIKSTSETLAYLPPARAIR